jgi:hypothetical protein
MRLLRRWICWTGLLTDENGCSIFGILREGGHCSAAAVCVYAAFRKMIGEYYTMGPRALRAVVIASLYSAQHYILEGNAIRRQ